jgi:hypothetical protein
MKRGVAMVAEREEERSPAQPCFRPLETETARRRFRGSAPPMGVSFHQIDRRFEGRESATANLGPVLRPGG